MHYYSTDGLNFIAAGTCKNKRSGACTEPAYNATISWSDGGSQAHKDLCCEFLT